MKQAKRIVALLLALVMVAGLAPAVFAAEENVTVEIRYVFQGGEIAANSWTASIAKGTGLNQTVPNPAVTGYAASFITPETPGVNFTAEAVELNLTNVQSDVTLTVTYVPALVNVTVNHFWQNAENDYYTLHEPESHQALTGSQVGGNLAKEYDGFYALPYDQTLTVAADGSTQVDIYYDRNYYLMTFDLGGGYGVEPVYARYGAAIGEVGTPIRPGYTFLGWTPETIPETMPAENTSYTAQWQAPESAKVTLVFWGENANDEDYSYLTSRETTGTPGQEMTYNPLTCGKEEHTHSDACISCTHTHTLDCYAVASSWGIDYYLRETEQPDALEPNQGNGIYTYTTGSGWNSETHYYLYLDGTWYCAYRDGMFGGYDSTRRISLNCSHTHDASCYACGKVEHTHNESCYRVDANLWTFVRADNITVAADGSSILNVYFDRTAFTLTFQEAGYRGSVLGTITAKWGANIVQEFQDISNANTFLWSRTTDGDSPWTSYLSAMPAENRTYYASTQGSSTNEWVSAQYIGEALNGGYTVNLFTTNFRFGDGLKVSEEEFVDIEGFTVNRGMSTPIDEDYDGAKFYYDRNSYTLRFYNYDGELTDQAKTLKYEESFQNYFFAPEYPANLEPNAYRFEGWYDAPFFTEDSWVDFATETMPANNVMLYANWVPVDHTVRVFTDNTMAEQIGEAQTVAHGRFATAPEEPTDGDYEFVGWFYLDNGVEKAFSFEAMPVRQDLDIYAKWSSHVPVAYTVRFQLADGMPIADPLEGYALAGTNRTFTAKGGEELYEGYQAGYFPQTASHTMTMDIEGGNEYVFVYEEKEEVPYTVRYLEAETEEVLHKEKTVSDNRHAVVTEYAETITGYLPDAYQKRLVVTAEGDNVLTFWYTKDDTHALVYTAHILVRGGTETTTQESTVTGTIGQTYGAAPLDPIPDGYVLDHITVNDQPWEGEGNPSGELTQEGLQFRFYYRYNRFHVYHQSTGRTTDYDVVENFDVTETVYDGYLYGGLYTDQTFAAPLKDNTCGLELHPQADEIYYVKEVDDAYLQPKTYSIYNTYYGKQVKKVYMATAIDDTNYQYVGFVVGETDQEEAVSAENAVYQQVEVTRDGQPYQTLTPASFFKGTAAAEGWLHLQAYTGEIAAGEEFVFTPFFVTPDGVKVTGTTQRTMCFGNGTYTGGNDGLHPEDAPVESTVERYAQPAAQTLTLLPSYAMSWDNTREYTVTKVDGGSTVTQTVEPGDQTGRITYAGQSGKVFAGWFADSACTLPAGFSDVQGDMTVYAKYVDAPQVSVSRSGGKLKTTVTLDTDRFAQVGFAYDCNGETGTVVAGEKTEKRSLLGWFFSQGNVSYQFSGSWSAGNLGFMDSFTVTPYWVTLDGTRVEGEAESFVSLGILIL